MPRWLPQYQLPATSYHTRSARWTATQSQKTRHTHTDTHNHSTTHEHRHGHGHGELRCPHTHEHPEVGARAAHIAARVHWHAPNRKIRPYKTAACVSVRPTQGNHPVCFLGNHPARSHLGTHGCNPVNLIDVHAHRPPHTVVAPRSPPPLVRPQDPEQCVSSIRVVGWSGPRRLSADEGPRQPG